eukprot:TRINITY_DN1011_c0_g4_i2.p3 TRINITY_DN1011_c0_g4~~TRINITY_DN1011_c0_g4_i2.p3  ORF type:complete len:224 (+),score=8.24 TRINITY_DN1011_c0_g4_i2:266-937(+)
MPKQNSITLIIKTNRMESNDIYKNIPIDKIPWIRENLPSCIFAVLESHKEINSIIDLGCGIGNYTRNLAQMGYTVCGIDISPTAINKAKEQFQQQKLEGEFHVLDMCDQIDLPDKSFDFAFDYEVLHHIYPEHREKYIQNVYSLLKDEGIYLSVCFSEKDAYFGGSGKYRDTPIGTRLYFSNEEEIRELMSSCFKILELKTIMVDGNQGPHAAVYCLMKKTTK